MDAERRMQMNKIAARYAACFILYSHSMPKAAQKALRGEAF
jgi:hypothetical protein